MTRPSVPSRFQKEGAASPCVLHGVNLSWKNCTVISAAMGMDKSTLGRVQMSGCAVREETNDHAGGTTLIQVQAVCSAHGVKTEAHTGSNVASLWYLAYQAALGSGFILQGNTQPDGRGNVNHAVWVNAPAGGGTPGNPDGFDVWDPWSNGPAYWSYSRTKTFMLALRPWGEGDPRTLKNQGIDGGYALVFPDTEPHVHIKYGAARTSPFPDHTKVKSPVAGRRVNVRREPDITSTKVKTLADGTIWYAYQKKGHWYGSHSGTQWVHDSGLVGEGGAS